MLRSRSPGLRAAAFALLGAALLLVAGLPSRGDSSTLPRALSHAIPLSMWFSRLPESNDLVANHASRVVERARRSPSSAARDVDLTLRRFCRSAPTIGHLARCARTALDADAEVEPANPEDVSDELPIRRIEGIGERANSIQRVSAENVNAMSVELRRAIHDLIRSVERCDLAAIALRESRTPSDFDSDALFDALKAAQPTDLAHRSAKSGAIASDAEEWLDAAIELADAIDRARAVSEGVDSLERFRTLPDGEGVPRNLIFASECSAGLVLIGGSGPTVMPLLGVALAIDLGGSDLWHADAAFAETPRSSRTSLLLDVRGDDEWRGDHAALLTACDGVVVAVDFAGADAYSADSFGVGAAVNGASLLVDCEGDDHYEVGRYGLGFGVLGAGVAIDLSGDDVYRGDRAILGVGAAGGLGAFVDLAGDDLYVTDLASRSPVSEYTVGATCTVAGLGEGYGLFIERSGADTYRLGRFGGGAASGGGLAACFDCGGDDLYGGAERCFGTGSDGGLGVLRDLAGDDDYLARGNSLGCGSGGIGVFVDDSGLDTTLALDPSRGAVEGGGFSIFADVDVLPTLRSDDSRPRRR